MPRKKNDPPKSPGGRFAKKGSENKRRRGSGPSLPLEDGAKGKRGSKSKGEANQAAAAAKPAKKMKSTWVPTSTRQLKAVRLAAEIRPHQGRSRGLYETAAFCSLVLGLFLAHQNGAMESFAMVLGEPDWPRCYNFAAELIGMSRNLARTTFTWFYDRNNQGHAGGEVLVNETPRGRASSAYKIEDARLLKPEHHQAIESFILECHGKGKTGGGRVTLATIRQHLAEKFTAKLPEGAPAGQQPAAFDVSRDVIRYCLKHQLGYSWGKIMLRKTQTDPARPAIIRSYLLRYSQALALEREGKAMIVYFDEVCTQDRGDGRVERGSSKGKRLIILHAITKDGPVGKRADLKWNKDMPHPMEYDKGDANFGTPFTNDESAELLWVASSNSGDYHDNMNSVMFMQWVQYKLWPTFEKQFPGKIMIPCCDNAPYHHNRGIPSLSGVTKKADVIDLIRNGVKGDDPNRFTGLPAGSTIKLPIVKGKRDVAIEIDVHTTEMGIKASKGSPTVPTIPELKNGFLETLRADATLKEFLACKLEKFIHDKNTAIAPDVTLKVEGGRDWDSWMLWTPPYKPALQPIEEFWGAGKNYSASLYKTDRTMKQVIAQLQAGWYGDDGSGFMNARKNVPKEAVDCGKLVKRSIVEANRMAKEVGGLSGKVEDAGGLVHDGESDLQEGDGDTDMYIRHIEEVDLTKDDGAEEEPLVLSEEDHEDDVVQQLAEGGAELVVEEEDDGAAAPPESPARAAQQRHTRE